MQVHSVASDSCRLRGCAGQNIAHIDSLFAGKTLGHESDIADGSLRGYEFRSLANIVGDYYVSPRFLDAVAVRITTIIISLYGRQPVAGRPYSTHREQAAAAIRSLARAHAAPLRQAPATHQAREGTLILQPPLTIIMHNRKPMANQTMLLLKHALLPFLTDSVLWRCCDSGLAP